MGITRYLPSSFGRQNPSHDKGVSSAGIPVSPVQSWDGSQGQASGTPRIEAVSRYGSESDALKKTIRTLQDEVRRLESEVKSLQQGQDFRSYHAEARTSHDKLQLHLRNIRHEIIAWSRMVQKDSESKTNVSALGEQLDKILVLENARELIENEDSTPQSRQEFPITMSDLFAAIASNIIVEQAILNPLISCTLEFRNTMNSKIYAMMSSDRSSQMNQKAAKMWQSACLKMYDLSDEFGSKHEKEIAREQCIDDIIFMVSKALRLEFYGQEPYSKLRRSIRLAVDIGKELGQSLSGLVPMNKGWLHEHVDGDGYISVSTMGSRIELRSPPDGGKTIVKGKVALVLFPGLLKYGSDDGEHWDSWTVWIPAKIHLMDEQIENIPPEVPDQHFYHPPAKIARSDHGMDCSGSQDILNEQPTGTILTTPGSDRAMASENEEDYVAIPLVDGQGRNAAGNLEVVIAVMGNTGSGKSSLIKLISGQDVEVGSGLEACTETVTAIRMDYKGVKLTLLDSPGFNDTYRSETQILNSISSFLSESYSHGFQLSGIIYLHAISNPRMEGSARLSLRMFRKLVGDDSLSNVILSSTHWSRVSPEEGTRREADLRDKFWKDLTDKGAAMMRHTGERESALALVDALINKPPVVLDIQHELVDQGKALIDTAAGSELNKELLDLQHRYETDLREVRKEMEIAIRENDQRNKSELDEIRHKLDNQLAEVKRNQSSLRERERVASRDRQRMQSQVQMLQMVFDKEKEELEKKFNHENERLRSKLEEAHAASEKAANSEFWSNVTDITNNLLGGFFVLLSAYARK
ncbi:hypothetical protein CEP51_001744 [Fusarium floridanum]|uniref:G domain-containing protein n=1 Tax=Fusarium floridanum TaxID=1325733 RepID=A0A428SF53_9HYPO|nr:hypothetical protein CEP51_001744 [Fusarium floridanum]